MKAPEFHSWLAERISRFIELRRLSGTDYRSQSGLLVYFDRFLVEQGLSAPLTCQTLDRYVQSLSHLRPRVRSNRVCVVRQLCSYLAQTDPNCPVPEPLRSIPAAQAYRPYIFSSPEINAILGAASRLGPAGSLRPHTYRTLLGVVYTCGLRISEACALQLGHFQAEEGRLYIAAGKFRKARWVPLHPSAAEVLSGYVRRRLQVGGRTQDCPLFVTLKGGALARVTVGGTFQQLLQQCGIERRPDGGPRFHDLRHSFAVNRLLAWYREGEDLSARLPALATYLGHANINATQVYLRPTAELLEEVSHRFHRHYINHIRTQGNQP